jgi:signal transduction histidine kinase
VERSVLRGLAVFRWAAWVWMATVLALARLSLVRPLVAVTLVVAALIVTIWATTRLRGDARRAAAPEVVGAEVAVALALQLADGFVYRAPHVFQPEQPLGVGWPTAAILSAGVAFGPWAGVGAGVLLGLGRAVSSVLTVAPSGTEAFVLGLSPQQTLSLVTTTVLYVLAGGIAGYATRLIRDAEARITTAERSLADARSREEVARRLHDGVLQTLALVERRTDDPQLAALARDQDRDLRAYLFHADDEVAGGELGDGLRAVAERFELTFEVRAAVLVPADLPPLPSGTVDAVVAAVGEALTNVGKHAGASRVVVSAEPLDDGWVAVSVVDDGVGFDPDTTPEGVGRARSIRGRVEDVGGEVVWRSRTGHGCEVRLTVPS